MKQKTKEQSKDEDEKLKPRESIMKIIMKYSPIKRDDLIEETSKLKIKPNLLHFHLEKLLADKIITRQKNPFSYSLSKDSIFHDWVIDALAKDSCKPKTKTEIIQIIKKDQNKENFPITEIITQLEAKSQIERVDNISQKMINSEQSSEKNYYKITDYYERSDVYAKHGICIRCKNKIKPGEMKLYNSYLIETQEIFEDQNIGTYSAPLRKTVIQCYHNKCIDKSLTDRTNERKKTTCAHCFLPLSRSQLINELNLDWNDETLVKHINTLFSTDPIETIWSSVNRKRFSEIVEQQKSLANAAYWYMNEPDNEVDSINFKNVSSNIFTCKEIEGKKYHPYCAKQIKKK
ncbi:hypothetical protein OAI67_01145 [Candidatus Nitrosopelagicus sp.]|nr:hypothetical protein [Candidatus Nitrosopelagicus sp.]